MAKCSRHNAYPLIPHFRMASQSEQRSLLGLKRTKESQITRFVTDDNIHDAEASRSRKSRLSQIPLRPWPLRLLFLFPFAFVLIMLVALLQWFRWFVNIHLGGAWAMALLSVVEIVVTLA